MVTAVPVFTGEPLSPEWHAVRARGIGGSDIAAVVGLSPWESPLSLWHRKRGELPDPEDRPEMTWGRRLEPVIAGVFCEAHPEWSPMFGGTFAHEDRPWQLANPDLLLTGQCACDGLIHDCEDGPASALLEVKTARFDDEWGTPGTAEIPVHYLCQVLWYLDVFGFGRAFVAVLIGGSDYREYVIEADPGEQEWLREHGRVFFESLADPERRPAIDDHPRTLRAVRDLHPDIDPDGVADLTETDVLDWHACRAITKAAEADERRASARVLDAMGSARRGAVAGRNAVIRVASRGASPHLRTSRRKARR